MTGRKGRVVSNDDGSISYESRSELDVPVEILNLTEKQRFMDGEKVDGWPLAFQELSAVVRVMLKLLVIKKHCQLLLEHFISELKNIFADLQNTEKRHWSAQPFYYLLPTLYHEWAM